MSPVERIVSQQHDIAAPLWEAEVQIAIALARLSKLGPGGLARYGWAGSWADYQKIAQLLCKTTAQKMTRRKLQILFIFYRIYFVIWNIIVTFALF